MTAASFSNRDWATCLNHYLPPSERRLFSLSSESSTFALCRRSDSVFPVRALRIHIDHSASFRQSDQLFVATCAKAGPYQNRGFPTGLWTLSRLLIRAKVWNALFTLGPTQQELSPAPGGSREVCLFRIYVLQPAGLLRTPSPGFTSCTQGRTHH